MNFLKLFYFTLLSTVLTSSLLTNNAHAIEKITSNTIEVTATRSTKDLMDVPLSVSVVTQEEIRKKNARNISDLLRDVPGVLIETQNNPSIDRIRIRGSSAHRTLILIDGQKLSSLNEIDGTQFSIDPSIIERIEVIKGPASVLYGAEAMGGVINIITKKGGTLPLQGELRTSYSSVNTGVNNNASIYGSNKGFNYRLSGSYNDTKDYESYHEKLPHSNKEEWSGNAFLSYDFSEKFIAGVLFENYNKDNESENFLLSANEPTTWTASDASRSKYAGFAELKNINPFLSRLRLDSYYQTYARDSTGYETAGTKLKSTTDNITDSFGLSLQSDWTIGEKTLIITGYEFLHEALDYDEETIIPLRGFSGHEYRLGEQNTHAGFISVEHNLPANFVLNYGMRYTHMQTQMDRNEKIANNGTITPSNKNGNNTESKPVFNIGLVWTGVDNLALRALWSQGFKPATVYQKYATSLANPNLKPETSDNFEIGARYYNNALTTDIAIFYTDANDLIAWNSYSFSLPSGFIRKYVNIGKSQKYGVELDVKYDFANGVTPYFSTTYLHYETEDNVDNNGLPRFTGKGGVRYYKTLKGDYWRLNADIYVQGQNSINNEKPKNIVPGFATFNLSAGVEWGTEHDFFAQVELLNILDKKYQFRGITSYYQAGINGALTVGYRF